MMVTLCCRFQGQKLHFKDADVLVFPFFFSTTIGLICLIFSDVLGNMGWFHVLELFVLNKLLLAQAPWLTLLLWRVFVVEAIHRKKKKVLLYASFKTTCHFGQLLTSVLCRCTSRPEECREQTGVPRLCNIFLLTEPFLFLSCRLQWCIFLLGAEKSVFASVQDDEHKTSKAKPQLVSHRLRDASVVAETGGREAWMKTKKIGR